MCQVKVTRRYGTLQVPTSSSCGGLVTFSHLEGPLGPLAPTPLPKATVGGPQVTVKNAKNHLFKTSKNL